MKSDRLLRVMSLESALFGSEDYKFENIKKKKKKRERRELTRPKQFATHICLKVAA